MNETIEVRRKIERCGKIGSGDIVELSLSHEKGMVQIKKNEIEIFKICDPKTFNFACRFAVIMKTGKATILPIFK